MRKSAKVDFFIVGDESPDLEIILNNLSQLPPESHKRTIEHNEDWLRLSRAEPDTKGFYGDMMRISMAPPGFRASLEGDITPLLFNSDEGLADHSAFYFDYESRILTLQRNSKAVSVNQFAHYLKKVADTDDVTLDPVLRPTDLSKVKTLQQLRKIHISASITDEMPAITDVDSHTQAMIKNAALAQSPAIELILKAGKGKEDTLNEAVAIETIESWLKIHENFSDEKNEIVKKILITGKDDTGERIEFDMLKDRMYTRMDYDWVPNVEELWANRVQKIQQAWDLNHQNLKQNLKAGQTGAE